MAKPRAVVIAVVGLFLVGGWSPAQNEAAPKEKRLVYLVKHGTAKELADALGKHFKGEVGAQVLADVHSNCLLISAGPAAFAEVVQLLDQLDRRPRLVSVEVLVVEAPPRPEAGKLVPADQELDERELIGPIDDVLAKVEALRKKRLLGSLKRVQLTAVENQLTSVTVGEMKPIVTSVQVRPQGGAARTIQYQNVGTIVRVTPRVAIDQTVVMDLEVQDARLLTPEDGIPLGKDENGEPIRATETVNARLNTKLVIPSGQALVLQEVKTTSKSGQARTLMIAAVRIVAEAKGGK